MKFKIPKISSIIMNYHTDQKNYELSFVSIDEQIMMLEKTQKMRGNT